VFQQRDENPFLKFPSRNSQIESKLSPTLAMMALCVAASPLSGNSQSTAGFHRLGQVIARATLGSVNAQVVPYATVVLTYTQTGTAASAFSDPGLSVGVPDSTLHADASGNYDYYLALNTCITESIASPNGGVIASRMSAPTAAAAGEWFIREQVFPFLAVLRC